MKHCILLLVCWGMLTSAVQADIIVWQEDYSDVSDWIVAYEPAGGVGTSISSDGTYGYFGVASNSSLAAFSPQDYMSFNEATWDTYSLHFAVSNITGSMSYSVGFDEFDVNTNYLNSVVVHPTGGGTDTFVGYTNHALSAVSWDAATAVVRPKITMSTGLGDQEMQIDDMQITQATIPEPTTVILFALGLTGIWRMRRRVSRK